VGFPITLGLGLLIMVYTLPTFLVQVEDLLRAALDVVRGLPAPAPG
jgi:flagellar biosynthesis protein FliR